MEDNGGHTDNVVLVEDTDADSNYDADDNDVDDAANYDVDDDMVLAGVLPPALA